MTWADVAKRYDVSICDQCPAGDHRRGYAHGNIVHWANRRMTKAGLRRFLMLVSSIRILRFAALPAWQQIYASNTWAANAAKDLHVRIPAHYSDNDRTRVRWLARNLTVPIAVKRWAWRYTP